jgi:hypothetical protein
VNARMGAEKVRVVGRDDSPRVASGQLHRVPPSGKRKMPACGKAQVGTGQQLGSAQMGVAQGAAD